MDHMPGYGCLLPYTALFAVEVRKDYDGNQT